MQASSTIRSALALVLGLAASVLAPGAARACGGLFCDRPPPNPFDPLPVAQTGENIVFAVSTDATTGDKTVEADIQIFYSGPAAQFSWVVPVDALPTVGVGTDQIFTTVASRTQPLYSVTWQTSGTCKPEPPFPSFGAAGGSTGSGTGAGGSTGTSGPPSVTVAFRGAVGPYDTAVIQSGSAAALLQWLADNGFYVGDDAAQIIAEYVSEQKYFVAIKLLNGQAVTAIQPVVLKFAGSVPCVPLRLTAIAALADLQVNLWVLGESRAVPQNYLELQLNEARLDWLNNGSNYVALVKEAANEATGNAFIAEYAGTARIMDGALWPDGRIDLPQLRAAATPPAYLQQVVSQGLTRFGPMLGLLEKYIPEPQMLVDMGISEATFYNQAATYWAQYQSAFAPFDPGPITDDVQKLIVQPLQAGQGLFDAHPYLTRLSTYISPEEMTKDPLFIFNPDLPDLSNTHTATALRMCGNQAYRACEAPVRLDTPGGQELWFVPPRAAAGNSYCYPSYDRQDLDQMPALGVAFQRAEAGQGTVVADNSAAIAVGVAKHNQPLAAAIGTITGADGGSGGCGCRSAGGRATAGGLVSLLGLALALARRRRGGRS